MADPIAGNAIQKVTEQAAASEAMPTEKVADASDVSRFEEAMQSAQADATETVNASQSSQPVDGPPQVDDPSLGDAILDGIERMKLERDQSVERINDRLASADGQPLSIEDTMKLQFELMQLNIQQDLTTKVADKSSQGVQQLFKNQ
jgi:type III secretion system YscI/HrpB-like protein